MILCTAKSPAPEARMCLHVEGICLDAQAHGASAVATAVKQEPQ